AKRADTGTTGHAIPGGDGFGAVPINLHFRPGVNPVAEMIASVKRGLFVPSTTAGYSTHALRW
ncbi:MAG: metallopeptidase TldD-related protein, partial [Acidimicrobiia bacterium]